MKTIPDLIPGFSNSWVIVSRATGKSVFETWLRNVALAVNQDRYEVLTAHAWLVRLNAQIALSV